jgi:hypothetical protein
MAEPFNLDERLERANARMREWDAQPERVMHGPKENAFELWRQTARILKDADPRPGMMTKEQERAQCRFVSKFMYGEVTEQDELEWGL